VFRTFWSQHPKHDASGNSCWSDQIHQPLPPCQRPQSEIFCNPQAPLDDLLRDFANPRENDRYFPFARHMDWFDGHSWASGYTVFAAGKNQVW
jgi:Glycosyl hydrolase family 81 C-terminal domain